MIGETLNIKTEDIKEKPLKVETKEYNALVQNIKRAIVSDVKASIKKYADTIVKAKMVEHRAKMEKSIIDSIFERIKKDIREISHDILVDESLQVGDDIRIYARNIYFLITDLGVKLGIELDKVDYELKSMLNHGTYKSWLEHYT